jgi:hypothetical protein
MYVCIRGGLSKGKVEFGSVSVDHVNRLVLVGGAAGNPGFRSCLYVCCFNFS